MENSDKQSLISAARRRAKAAARADGESHQSHLERLAREAGREDWAAFLSDPVELPEHASPTSIPENQEADHQSPRRGRITRILGGRSFLIFVQGFTGLSILLVLMLVNNKGWLFAIWNLMGGAPSAILFMPVAIGLGFMWGSCIALWFNAAFATYSRFRRKLPASELAKSYRAAISYSVTPIACLIGITLIPSIANSTPLDAALAMQQDQMHLHPIRMHDEDDRRPVAVLSDNGRYRHIAVIFDWRSMPKSLLRNHELTPSLGKSIQVALVDNPVIRIVYDLDCASGTYRARAIEATKSVAARAAAIQPKNPTKTYVLDEADRHTVCNAPVAIPEATETA